MLEIFRAISPKIIPYITEKFGEFENLDQREAVEVLLFQQATDPEHTGIFVIFEDEELKGFIFGWVHFSKKYLWIEQAWGSPDIKTEHKQEVFEKFIDWGSEFGTSEVRAQTERMNMQAWEKTYGMKEFAVIIRKEF